MTWSLMRATGVVSLGLVTIVLVLGCLGIVVVATAGRLILTADPQPA